MRVRSCKVINTCTNAQGPAYKMSVKNNPLKPGKERESGIKEKQGKKAKKARRDYSDDDKDDDLDMESEEIDDLVSGCEEEICLHRMPSKI